MSAPLCTGTGGRGCGCAWHERRRHYHREHARQKRATKLAAQNRTAFRCQRRAGPSVCNARLETTIGDFGQSVTVCPACERRKRGICRDCPKPVDGAVGKALRCTEHKEAARRESIRASEERHHEERLANARAYYQRNEEIRRRRNEYKRAYRKAHPEKVRAQKQRYVEKHRADPNSAYNRYHARYRRKYREQKREMERDRLVSQKPERTQAPKCKRCGKSTRWRPLAKGHAGKPWTICTPCLFPSERKIRLRNRARARARAQAWIESIPPAKKIKRPPNAPRRGPGGERLCITLGCETVLTHRKKKCRKCLAAAAALAAHKLEEHRGRGRRTDLVRVA